MKHMNESLKPLKTTKQNPNDERTHMTTPIIQGFSFTRRNPGHWDVYSNRCRLFALRGAPGCYFVRDEREEGVRAKDGILIRAKTIGACVQRITEELMFELIIADSQEFTVIEQWNINKE